MKGKQTSLWARALLAGMLSCAVVSSRAGDLSGVQTVFVIVMENLNWTSLVGTSFTAEVGDTVPATGPPRFYRAVSRGGGAP